MSASRYERARAVFLAFVTAAVAGYWLGRLLGGLQRADSSSPAVVIGSSNGQPERKETRWPRSR